MILLSGVCLGWKKADELKKRENALLELKQLLQNFRTGILYSAQPIGELILRNRDSCFCSLASGEKDFYKDPKGSLKSAGKSLLKENSDRKLYEALIDGLGESDTQGQIEHLSLYDELLENNLTGARESREKKSRLYLCLGIFGGIAVCLILL